MIDDARRIEWSRSTIRVLKNYNDIFRKMEGEPWFIFMNHGYLPSDEERAAFPALQSQDDPWRHQVFLYVYLLEAALRAAGIRSLSGRALLDVGCGRGGGLSIAKRYYNVTRAVGLDLNPLHVAFCQAQHRNLGLEFVAGNAMGMAFPDCSFDVVMNVESSHCYPDMAQFLDEVHRVLRPGGMFLLTDVRPTNRKAPLDANLRQSHMGIEFERDITERVLAACRLDTDRFQHAFDSPKTFLPTRASERAARRYAAEEDTYMAYVLRKPG